jgi:hypothetical protein
MRSVILSMALTLGAAIAVPAGAQTRSPTDNLERWLDPGDVKAVAAVLQEHGYKAEIKKDDQGTPYLLSGANGNSFQIYFYGCKDDKGCDSYEFYSWYKKEPLYTVELVNEWNATKRFLKVVIDKDGDLAEYMYGTAIGRTTYANFLDGVEWFATMDGALAKFLSEKREKADPAAKPKTDKK